MRIISKRKLREFWSRHSNAEGPLLSWHDVAEKSEWNSPNEVRGTFRSADPVGDEFVVFNICNNEYRLVVRVDYARLIIYVWGVYTHPEYDRIDLRAIDERIKAERRSGPRRHG